MKYKDKNRNNGIQTNYSDENAKTLTRRSSTSTALLPKSVKP